MNDTCPVCLQEVDYSLCHCGNDYDDHNPMEDGHSPVPLGCTCYYTPEREPSVNNRKTAVSATRVALGLEPVPETEKYGPNSTVSTNVRNWSLSLTRLTETTAEWKAYHACEDGGHFSVRSPKPIKQCIMCNERVPITLQYDRLMPMSVAISSKPTQRS